MSLKACIYDLDGVITDTAKYHYQSWKWVADQLEYHLTEKQNQKLKGVGRKESLEKIIKWSGNRISEADKQRYLLKKNAMYLEFIDTMTPDEVFPGFKEFNDLAKVQGIKVAIGSSSRNAIRIIDKLDLVLEFHAIVDGGMTENSKPEPDIFLLAAEKLQCDPSECLVIEDSQAGLTAAKKAGMKSILYGEDKGLKGAHLQIDDWSKADLEKFKTLF
ncbi:MAG TPA: beta-phosphoglucomutase [Bacteroidetes bacterium]|jgi:beta-phosphoglucomutase|nr:beta-phosphoglucomutase [Bacteroidota bacterium]|tara:strand:- start:676 stop:1326 length:651 start_codon:yes stop_codon:yes gene_type:complete